MLRVATRSILRQAAPMGSPRLLPMRTAIAALTRPTIAGATTIQPARWMAARTLITSRKRNNSNSSNNSSIAKAACAHREFRTLARGRPTAAPLVRFSVRHIHGRQQPGGNPFSGGGGGGFGGAGTPFGMGGMGPGGPIAPWKVLAVAGGLVVITVSGVVMVGSVLGPVGLGLIGAWWFYRKLKRFKWMYDASGGAANPNNPFRNGPFTPEAREAARVLRVQQQVGAMFRTFARAAGVSPDVQNMDMGMGGIGAAAAEAAATQAETSTSFEAFLVRKTRATLLEQSLRHQALYALSAAVTGSSSSSAASAAKPRITVVSSSAHEVVSRTGGLELRVDETLELAPPVGAAVGAGAASGRGTLRARYTLRLTPDLVQKLQGELDHWRRLAAAALAQQQAHSSASGSAADPLIVSSSLPYPDPFDGRMFTCVSFESVTFTPQHSRRPVDLAADPSFREGRAKSGAAIVQEAEFEEIRPNDDKRR